MITACVATEPVGSKSLRADRMKTSRSLAALTMVVALIMSGAAPPANGRAPNHVKPGQLHSFTDIVTTKSGEEVHLEEGLLFVPENRRDSNSRPIAVGFVRIPVSTRGTAMAPLFHFKGGPGSVGTATDLANGWLWNLAKATNRDIVLVNQRGSSHAPATPALRMLPCTTRNLNQAAAADDAMREFRACFQKSLDRWKGAGVDLSGYDIKNWVQDIEDVRTALGYSKVIPVGGSFGSQTSIAFLKMFPDSVDRMVLWGIEPLDHAYDSPVWVWNAYERLAALAETDTSLRGKLPVGGLVNAVVRALARLEKQPVEVSIKNRDAKILTVRVGAEDLRSILQYPVLLNNQDRLAAEKWPRFVTELDAGDYRYVAAVKASNFSSYAGSQLIFFTIDNSLGITADRDRALVAEAKSAPVGDVNWYYRATRGLSPTPVVDDAFRRDPIVATPVMLVQGDIDPWTPLGNAAHLASVMPNAKLIVASRGGTHWALAELIDAAPDFQNRLRAFLRPDSTPAEAAQVLSSMPAAYDVKPLVFEIPGTGVGLYEQWLAGRIE